MTSGVRSKLHVVLLVEDNVEVRELYAEALRDAAFVVEEVGELTQAIDAARMLCPDIVVLDRRLPDGDGWDLARAFKASPATKAVPIIACTSHNQRADVESALVAGCDSFFAKGSTPDSLVRHVRGMLGLPLERSDTVSDRTRDPSRPASSLA
jgi:CheY-like chemotaxis protein